MSNEDKHYEFGDFRLKPVERQLLRQGKPVALTPKAFETLLVLVQRSGRLVEKDELMREVWAGAFVEEANLARNIWTLRKALGEDETQQRYIETVPKRGYRFVARVIEASEASEPTVALSADTAVVSQKRVRARIVSVEEETSEESQAPTRVTIPAHSIATSTALSLATVQNYQRRKRVLGLLAIASLVAAVAITTVIFRRARSNSTTKSIESLAVLPFINLSNDPELDYLSEGITASLINRLSLTSRLKIVAHNSVVRYKGKELDAQKAGSDLDVQAVLIGRLEVRGEELSIRGELVDVRDGSHIWGAHYNRKISDLQSLQRELVQDMTSALQLQLSGDEKTKFAQAYTGNPDAYQLYLKGRYFWNKRTRESMKRGLEYFEQAIRLDPNYAAAHVGVADCYSVLSQFGEFSPIDAMPKAKAAALSALRIDDTLAEAHASLGMIYEVYDWDWKGAEREFKRAIELNPNYATGHHWYAMYLSAMGRRDEALSEIRKAQALDPVSLITNTNEGWILFCAREYDQAIGKLRSTIEMDPNFANAHFKLALVYEIKGMYKEAVDEYLKDEALSGAKPEDIENLKVAYARSGWKGYCGEKLRQLRISSKQGYVLPKYFVLAQLQLGDADEVFRWLEQAFKERAELLVYLRVDPRFDSLRSDPRFAVLLSRMNLQS